MSQDESVAMIKSMLSHIPEKTIRRTLTQVGNDMEQALDLLLTLGDSSFDAGQDEGDITKSDEAATPERGTEDGTPSSAGAGSLLLPKTDRTAAFQTALQITIDEAVDPQFLDSYDDSLIATLLPLLKLK